MPRKIGHVPSPKPGQGATLTIPQEVKDEVDELYDFLRQNPTEEGYAEFEGVDEATAVKELKEWTRQVRAYCLSREAGALKFRQLPSKHLPPTAIRFTITADIPANAERNGKPAVS